MDRRYIKSMAIASINPATGEKIKEFKPHNDAEIEKRLKRAEHAFQQHRRESFPKRAQLLVAVATLLDRAGARRIRFVECTYNATRLKSFSRWPAGTSKRWPP